SDSICDKRTLGLAKSLVHCSNITDLTLDLQQKYFNFFSTCWVIQPLMNKLIEHVRIEKIMLVDNLFIPEIHFLISNKREGFDFSRLAKENGYFQIINIREFHEIQVTLVQVTIYDNNIDAVGKAIIDQWMQEIKGNQKWQVASQLPLIKNIANIGEGIFDLFYLPYSYYQQGMSVLDGTYQGVQKFVTNTTQESINLTSAVFSSLSSLIMKNAKGASNVISKAKNYQCQKCSIKAFARLTTMKQNISYSMKISQRSALRTYEKCLYSTCFDAEYIEFKQGASFNYSTQFYDYASQKSGECMRDPIVVKYSGRSQSTKNYIEEKQDCFDRNAVIYDPNQSLTDINETQAYCKVKNPKCDTSCQQNVSSFDSCILQEEQKFTVQKNFWNLQSELSDFKKQILSICANKMKAQINFSPQFQTYVHCIQKTLDKSSSQSLKISLILISIAFLFSYML
ncbi:hypothetical protein ABPG72_020853, partial [Tetrahymena utriculariae]